MKKILALVLAMIMALSMGVAFADEEQGQQTAQVTASSTENGGNVNLPKKYILAGTSGQNPEETFSFTFESVAVTGNTNAKVPTVMPSTDGVNFKEAEATADGLTKYAVIKLPTYTATGYYWYKVTETDNNYEGVTYHAPFYMKVTVTQDNAAYKLYVAFYDSVTIEKESDGDKIKNVTGSVKIGGIENTYTAGQLKVTKNVAGQLGDKNQDFAFVITLSVPDNDTVTSTVGWAKTAQEKANNTEGTADWNLKEKSATINVELKNGEYITITNIPSGVTYSITETAANSNGYTTTYTVNDNMSIDYNNGVTGSISENANDVNVIVTNTNGDENINTGMLLDNAPYMIIMALVLVGAAMMLKRRAYND